MPIVAVAGGTGKLGRAIVDAIVAAGQFEAVVLSRQADDEKAKEIGARIVATDYTSPDAIASVLEANKVDIVISTVSSLTDSYQEINLIKGADKCSVTKRYIPSIWGIRCTKDRYFQQIKQNTDNNASKISSYFPPAAIKMIYLEALESTSLKWTAVLNGYFLDYYGSPKVKTYMPPMALVIDVANNAAAIPGTGDVPAVFTHTFDVANFVAALLTRDDWEKESYIIGDKLTLNEFVQIAEEVKKTKFTVETDSIDKLKTGQVTELPSHPASYPFFPKPMLQGMFAAFGIMFATGVFYFNPNRTFNDVFPEIRPQTVKQLLSEAYGA